MYSSIHQKIEEIRQKVYTIEHQIEIEEYDNKPSEKIKSLCRKLELFKQLLNKYPQLSN